MGETDAKITSTDNPPSGRNRSYKTFDPSFLVQLPNKLQSCLKLHLGKLAKDNDRTTSVRKEEGPPAALRIDLERQLHAWRENPSWVDEPPEIKVSVPKGSLCNLNVKCDVGLPPDAIYNIVTDPDNRRVFKSVKETISRKILLDEGHRQVVELEQAAIWKFLWWSGTISVHLLVDQNRQDLTSYISLHLEALLTTNSLIIQDEKFEKFLLSYEFISNKKMKFKQLKTGFMKKFEGCWRVEPLFVDENICYPYKPKTWAEYHSCTGGKGRLGSKVSLEQLVQPALVPPPPISWYLRGITSRTSEMIVYDLLAEAARIRGDFDAARYKESETSQDLHNEHQRGKSSDIKERWAFHRRNAKYHRRLLTA